MKKSIHFEKNIFTLKKITLVLGALFLMWGHLVSAQVRINEIAWMGNIDNANAEWIELFNDGADAVPLDEWKLVASDGTPMISLAGTMEPGEYFLLERTSDASIPEVLADIIYSGALGNTGEVLQLKNSTGSLIDEVRFLDEWPAGDNTTKNTMQKESGGDWITAPGTPRAINASEDYQSPTDENSSGSPSHAPDEDPSSEPVVVKSEVKITQIKPDPQYGAKVTLPDFAVEKIPTPFSVEVKKDKLITMIRGKFIWSMGDGTQYAFEKNEDVIHAYQYPGNYTVVLPYYSNFHKEEPDTLYRKQVTVIPDNITLTGRTDDAGIILENHSTREIDLDAWSLTSNGYIFTFPKYTFIGKGSSLPISSKTLGFSITDQPTSLLNPRKEIIHTFQEM